MAHSSLGREDRADRGVVLDINCRLKAGPRILSAFLHCENKQRQTKKFVHCWLPSALCPLSLGVLCDKGQLCRQLGQKVQDSLFIFSEPSRTVDVHDRIPVGSWVRGDDETGDVWMLLNIQGFGGHTAILICDRHRYIFGVEYFFLDFVILLGLLTNCSDS